ncbi:cytochrome p450 [Colletotrichum truncatum]|uniref:Cytochrome p450 n=1 Tax=Colletotrichum truncatum TaxID=5467 RepID=A0ACC3YW55_COLTU|nr:cytochrome p450 [Colletotrichum truncatum]KAF6785870.1 cytochrome p450 [Colletotrichum truncatum]
MVGILTSTVGVTLTSGTWSLLLNLIAFIAVAVFFAWEFRSWYRLRNIPGPFIASISVLWQLKKAVGGTYHEHLNDVARKYGPLVRIGPNELLCTDPDSLRKISGVRSLYTKGDFYATGRITPGVDNVVSMRDEEAHKAMRARMAPAYAAKENEGFSFESGIDRQLMNFIRLIDQHYVSTDSEFRPLDLAEKTQFFALDAIGDISFGDPFGFLAEDRDLFRYIEINESSLPVLNVVSVLPWLGRLVHKWPFRLMMPKENDQVGFGRLMGFAKNYVEMRLQPGAKPQKDMMQTFINQGLNLEELIQIVYIHMIAGTNSAAQAMRMTLLCLINNPVAYRRLQQEIDDCIAAGTISSPITDAEALKLPYLQAVIREGLRVYPPVTGLGFKQTPKGGDILNGYFVPGGTQIGQNYFGVGRSQWVWGPDADVFRPERWLSASEEEVKQMDAVLSTHFGHGKYSCPGKPIAMMELNKVFVELLRRYDLTVVNPEKPIKTLSAIFFVARDFWVTLTRRSP